MTIKFGPAGLGSVKDAVKRLEELSKASITACEISFTYGPYIKPEEAPAIKEAAEKYKIQLSIHAPYWVNLNSDDPKKIEMSKKRILKSCEIGELLGAKYVVFHPGFYGKRPREEAYVNIKKAVKEMMKDLKERKYEIKIAAETMGKINVFGSIEEIKKLVKETGCSFCLDFAHLWARSLGTMEYSKMVEEFKEFDSWHCHFSGIVYGDKGERNHIPTPKEQLKALIAVLPTGKNISIINESPQGFKDSKLAISIYKAS